MGIVSKEPIFIYGPNSLFGTMGSILNFDVIGNDLNGNYPQVDEEYILRQNPSVLVTTKDQNWDSFFDQHDVLTNTNAFKKHHIFQIEGDYISRQGPRSLMGLLGLQNIAKSAK